MQTAQMMSTALAADRTRSARLPRVVLDPEPGDGAAAFDMWREVGRPAFDVGARVPVPNFSFAGDFYEVAGIVFSRNRFAASTFTRRQSHLHRPEGDFITLHMAARGTERGLVSNQPYALAADRICLQDWAHPFATAADTMDRFRVVIPRRHIVARDWIYEQQPTITWRLDAPPGRMLAQAWRAVWDALPMADAADAPALAAGFLGLLNGLLAALQHRVAGPSATAAGMLPCMKQYIDAHLGSPGLGVLDLQKAFRCSRATVYRLFEDAGGVQAHIRERRLLECFRALTAQASVPPRIGDVAACWGFVDHSHFHRVFRKRFGCAPTEAVAASQRAAHCAPWGTVHPPGDPIRTVHAWLRQ